MSGSGGGDSSRLASGTTTSNPAAAVAAPAAADTGGAGHVPLALLLWDVATGAAAVMVAVAAGMLCVRDCLQVLAGSSFGFGAAATAGATADDTGSGAGGPGPQVTSGSSQQQQAAGPEAVWEQRTLWIVLRALMPLLLTLLLLPLPARGVWARLWPQRRQPSRASAADAGSATAEQLTAAPADASPRPWYVSRRNPAGAIPALAAAATVPPQRLSDDGTTADADAAAQDAGGAAACRQHHQQQRAALTMAITSSLYGSSTTAAAIPFAGGVGGCQRSAAAGSVAQLHPTAGPTESGGARGRRVIGLVRARCWSLGSGGLQDRYITQTGGAAGGVTAAAAKAAVSAAASAAASGVGSALRRSLDSVLGAGGGSCCRRAPAASLRYGMGGIEPVHAAAAPTAAAVHMRAAAEEPPLRPVLKTGSALELPQHHRVAAMEAAGSSAPSGIVGAAPPPPPLAPPPAPPPAPPSVPLPPMLPLRLPAVPSPFTNAPPLPPPGPPPPRVQAAAARSAAAAVVLGMQRSSGSLASSGGLQGSASTGSDCGSGISAAASIPWRGGGGGLSRGLGGRPVLRATLVGRPITAAAPTGTPDNNGPAPSATAAVSSMAVAASRSVAAAATVADGGAAAARTGVRRPPLAPYVGLTCMNTFSVKVHNPTGSHESYARRLAAAMAPMLLHTASTSLASADIHANSSNTCDENSIGNASGGGDASGRNQGDSARVDSQPLPRVLPARLPRSPCPSSSSTHTPFQAYQQHRQPSVGLALDPATNPAATAAASTSITAAASAVMEAAAVPAADQSPPRERQASDETAWPASPRQQQLPAAHSISNPDMSSLAIDAAIASATAAATTTGIAVAAAAAPAADVEERPARSFIGISPGAAAAPPAVYMPPSAAAALIASGTGGPPQRHSGGGGSGGRSPQPTGGYVVVHGCVQLIAWAREVAGWKPGSGGGGTAAAATTSLPPPRPPSPAPPPGLTRADSFLLLSSPAAEFEDSVLDEADADAGQRREAAVGLEVRPRGSSGGCGCGSWGGWRRQLQQLLPDCDAIGPWGMQLWRRREALQPGLLVPTGGGSSCAACTCGALLCGPFCVPIAPASSPPLELELGLTSAAPQTLRLLLVQHGTLLADFTCVLGAGPQVLLLPVPPQPQPTVMQLVFAPAAGAATASTPLLYDIATLLAIPDDVAAELAELSQVMRMEYGDGGGAANISTGGGAAWRDHYAALVSDLAYIMERAASGAVAAAAGTASDGTDTASDDPVWAVAQHLHAYLALLQASAAATTAPERGAETTPQAAISANAAVSATGGASAAAAPAAVARAPATVAFVAEALHQALLVYA